MQDMGIKVLLEGNNLQRLLVGLSVTLWISFLSIGISSVAGLLVGIIMTSKNRLIVWILRIYLETIRIVPQLVLLFLFYFGLARGFNINISGELVAIIVFSLWGTAEMGDLVRGAITSLPKHQFDSGLALGLSKRSLYRYVIIPQVLRRLLPQAINLVTRMIKTSSLAILSRSFFADSSYMLSFSVLCSCVCSRLISPSVSSWHKQDNTLMHQSPGHIQRRTPYNF